MPCPGTDVPPDGLASSAAAALLVGQGSPHSQPQSGDDAEGFGDAARTAFRETEHQQRLIELLLVAEDDQSMVVEHGHRDSVFPQGLPGSRTRLAALSGRKGSVDAEILISLSDAWAWRELWGTGRNYAFDPSEEGFLEGLENLGTRAKLRRNAFEAVIELCEMRNEKGKLGGGAGLKPLPRLMLCYLWVLSALCLARCLQTT
jgi:hypothetical protein